MSVPAHVCSRSAEDDRFLDVATAHVRKEYGQSANEMSGAFKGRQDGLVVSVEIPNSSIVARYWIICEEVTPVSAGVPSPEKKWKRVCCLGISGPKYGAWAYMWIRELTDSQYDALRQIESRTDIKVESEVVKSVIRDKVLPEQATEWHKGVFLVRATKAFVWDFTFRTRVTRGGNLIGVTLYLDTDGSVIAKSEAMMHID